MKIIIIIITVLLLAFLMVQIFAWRSQRTIESYPYELIKEYQEFEIRKYEASLFTSVTLSTNEYKEASSKGFSILAGYIFGGNSEKEKISMTSPVAMSLEDSMTMMFMVPRELKKENLPTPDQKQIEFKEEPAKTVAAISFGGWASDEKIKKYKKKLIAALEAENITYGKSFNLLGYNPPYEVFNRKNEIIVELNNY